MPAPERVEPISEEVLRDVTETGVNRVLRARDNSTWTESDLARYCLALKSLIRELVESDEVARLGGDETCLVYSNLSGGAPTIYIECRYCGAENEGNRIDHNSDCAVILARALLGEDGR